MNNNSVKGTILVAEDDSIDAELTIRALSKTNLINPIIHCKDGEEVIGKLEEIFLRGEPLSFILLDLNMPKLSGLDVLKYIRANENYKHIPTIMLTTSSDNSEIKKAYEHGASAFLTKPVDPGTFISTIQSTGSFWGVYNCNDVGDS